MLLELCLYHANLIRSSLLVLQEDGGSARTTFNICNRGML